MSSPKTIERSAGFIVFKEEGGGVKYLFLRVSGRLDFPKGNIEKDEDELSAALRELKEESGIAKVRIIPGFRRVLNYYYRRGGGTLVSKTLILFLGEALGKEVSTSWEHEGFEWLSFEDAVKKIKYHGYRKILEEAEEHRVKMVQGSLGRWINGDTGFQASSDRGEK
ncbi:MAG: NUDIX domain-containing protein [Thermoproteota archaeon]